MMQNNDVLEHVQRTFNVVNQTLGRSYSREKLFWLVERSRGKPLKYEERKLPSGYPGCCFALQDVDVVCVRAGLEPGRKLWVDLHEAGHFLLQHVPRLSFGAETPSYDEYRQHIDQIPLDQALCRSVFDEPPEQAAELLGRSLATIIRRYEQSQIKSTITLPPSMASIYGDEKLPS